MSAPPLPYEEFLRAKVAVAESLGFDVADSDIHPILKPHQRAAVRWALSGGRRALFESFGLGKSVQQLEIVRLCLAHAGGPGLIVAPLGVRQEFMRDAAMLGTPIRFVRRDEECSAEGIHLTNYESVRDGKINPRQFTAVSLDEASILRGFGGTKTFREAMRSMAGDGGRGPKGTGRTDDAVRYRFVATATPSPNEYIELLAYAAFLGIMDVSQAKTRFFKRDSTKADTLTIHPHKEAEFWSWVASWALFLQSPADLGFDATGYDMPELDVRWHEVASDHATAGAERDGQGRMFRNAAIGVVDASREKRDSLPARIAKLLEIRAEEPDEHRLIWHDLEAEREAIEAAIPDVITVWGSQDMEEREQAIADFSDGKIRELATKPVIAGSGCNFQRFCARAVFLGVGFKFNDFIQAVHRIKRFLQTRAVRIDIIYTEAERDIVRVLREKWANHETMVARMSVLIRERGLAHGANPSAAARSMGVKRLEVEGPGFRLVRNDTILETRAMPSDSVHLIVTSIPFSTQYEYTPSFNDLGHTDDNDHFFRHLDYLTPELLRVLQPGRVAAIHVKDRIVPGGLTGLGFQTVSPFSDDTIRHFTSHGWAFLGRKTIVTDVVRENNQTYRLGWTEQCKDGSRMGAGMPEYLLLFRKPPTDSSDGYADVPVVKDKAKYSRSRWQVDAHGFMRSSGDRLVMAEDLVNLAHEAIFKRFRKWTTENVYDFEKHVSISEALEAKGILPTTFMLLQPASWHPDVWTDIARMRTLNMVQERKGQEQHLCPLQFDIVDRVITQYSMKGETVYDPFGGLMTVPYCAIRLGREGLATELNGGYFADGAGHCEAAARELRTPTLFDFADLEEKAS